jgi:DNA-binding FrmR family transcriptional regulator
MRYEFRDGRLHLSRTPEEKEPLLQRLRRIEGQVRGVRQMVEDDRYCLDEVQQANAITAGMRQLALLIISDHLTAAVDFAVQSQDGAAAVREMIEVLRAGLRQ